MEAEHAKEIRFRALPQIHYYPLFDPTTDHRAPFHPGMIYNQFDALRFEKGDFFLCSKIRDDIILFWELVRNQSC